MTVEEFFGDTPFAICEGFMLEVDTAVAYKRPRPILFVSKQMFGFIEKKVEEPTGALEFVRKISLNVAEEHNPVFKPIDLSQVVKEFTYVVHKSLSIP